MVQMEQMSLKEKIAQIENTGYLLKCLYIYIMEKITAIKGEKRDGEN